MTDNSLCMELRSRRFGVSIQSLLTCRGPAHITWFVMAVIILTVDGVCSRGLKSKFVKKLFKRGEAKFYAASSVAMVANVFRIFTAAFRTNKSGVFRRPEAPSSASTATVRNSTSSYRFLFKTAAGADAPMSDARPDADMRIAARTQAQPEGMSSSIDTRELQNEQLIEGQAKEILKTRRTRKVFRNWFSIVSSHFDPSFGLIWLGRS